MTNRPAEGPRDGFTATTERKDLLAALKSGVGWALAATLIAALITFVLQINSEPVYRAEATLLLTKTSAEGSTEGGPGPLLAPRLSPETYRATIPTAAVLEHTTSEAQASALRGRVDVSVDEAAQSALLHVGVRSNDPDDARRFADAVAEAAIAWDVARARRVAEDRAAALARQIEELRARRNDDAPAVQAARLDRMISERQAQLEQARSLEAAADSPLRLVQAARTPATPVSPRPLRNTVLVGVLAGLAALGGVLLMRAARRD